MGLVQFDGLKNMKIFRMINQHFERTYKVRKNIIGKLQNREVLQKLRFSPLLMLYNSFKQAFLTPIHKSGSKSKITGILNHFQNT